MGSGSGWPEDGEGEGVGRLVRVGVVGADESLLGIAGHWRWCLYSMGGQVSLRVCNLQVAGGHGGAVDLTSCGE